MPSFINQVGSPSVGYVLQARTFWDLEYADGLFRQLFAIFHYFRTGGDTFPNQLALANAFDTQVSNTFGVLLNVRCTNIKSDIRIMDDPMSMPVESTNTPTVGGVTGDPLPANSALVVKLLTGFRGRSFQGRKHIGGLSEDDIDSGDELNAGAIAAWNAALANWVNDIVDGSGNTYSPCVLSPTLSTLFTSPPTFTGATISSVVLNKIIGTMRKRKEKVPS